MHACMFSPALHWDLVRRRLDCGSAGWSMARLAFLVGGRRATVGGFFLSLIPTNYLAFFLEKEKERKENKS